MRIKVWITALVLFLLLPSCNLPTGQTPATQPPEAVPVSSDVDVVGTSVALTMSAQIPESADSAVPLDVTFTPSPTPTFTLTPTLTPTSTPCIPLVTSTANANVRSGPATAYNIVGSLLVGQTATVAGRNDANTWWYIDYPGASGGHAWIAGSVVTASCLPAVVQVVAAPPLPTAVPTDTQIPTPVEAAKPDLIVSEFTISPATPIMGQNAHVRIGAYNQGNAAAGQILVLWYGLSTAANPGCSWVVDSIAAKGGRILECDYVFQSWYPVNKTSMVIVDANNQVNESNEGNNQGFITPFGVAQP